MTANNFIDAYHNFESRPLEGGLLHDLMKLMRDACKNASIGNVDKINNKIAEEIIQRQKNDYITRFEDQEMELEYMRKILDTKQKRGIPIEKLNFLLNFLFILEYCSSSEDLWYDVHPCLKDYINTQ